MQRFVRWDYDGEYTPFGEAFDQGNTCSSAIFRYMQSNDISSCGGIGEHANGNGALMRILPVCLYYYQKQKEDAVDDETVINGIHTVSGLTHNHIRSKMCCGLYYFMIRSILDTALENASKSLQDLLQQGIDEGLKFYRKDIANLMELTHMGRVFDLKEFKAVPEESIRTTGYVVDTIEAAIWCLINTESYKDCMLKAVNLGNDTDTVAAIAGGLAGLYYGYDAIPDEWFQVIKRRAWVEEMCNKVCL